MSNPTNTPTAEPVNAELVSASEVLGVMERASIDTQIATAKRYPRELSVAKSNMVAFATLDEETAKACFYTLPPRKGAREDKPIQGPSARLAEIAVSCYGHIRAGSRIIANDGKTITAQGFCHDLQQNVLVAVETKRRITTKEGRTFSEDMQVVVGNAASSIAFRNAVFKVVPMALVKPALDAAKRLAIGEGTPLPKRRADALKHFDSLGVSKERVLTTLGVRTVEDILGEQLITLLGLANAIKEGDTTVEEAFPQPGAKSSTTTAPQGGFSAAVDQPKAAEKTEPLKAATAPAAPEFTAEQREQILGEVQNKMLDFGKSESAVLNWARERDLVPEGVDEVGALPTASLDRILREYLPAKKTNGGAK